MEGFGFYLKYDEKLLETFSQGATRSSKLGLGHM
jgi:hypothetical protein